MAGPQLLSRNSPLTPLVWNPDEAAMAQTAAVGAPPAPVLAPLMPATPATMPSLGAIANTPSVTTPLLQRKSAVEADLARREAPAARPTTVLGKIGHTAANIGNVLGEIFAPAATENIKGTRLNNEKRRQQDISELDEISQLQSEETGRQSQEATAAYNRARPAIEQSKIDQKQRSAQNAVTQRLGSKGLVPTFDADGNLSEVAEDPSSSIVQHRQAAIGLAEAQTSSTQAQEELRQAQTEYERSRNDPNAPAYKLAMARLQVAQTNARTAQGNLDVRQKQYMMHAYGTGADGQALPGTMIGDDGRPVGTSMQGNVRPTGQERNKADMAFSAEEQLSDIKTIMQRHPDLFGPGYGRASAFRQWIGSQDPDAQRFVAARTIAGDHLAGTFGGRSEAALTALDHAIGQFKDNPDAAIAGIDQLTKANTRFEKAGTVRTTGSAAAKQAGRAAAAPSGMIRARDPQGKLHQAPAGTPLPAGWKKE